MDLLIEGISSAPTAHSFRAGAAWRKRHLALGMAPGEPVVGDLSVALEVRRSQGDLHIEGAVQSVVEVLCSRCLLRSQTPFSERFRLLLEPAGAQRPSDPDAARALESDGFCLDEHFRSGCFQGNALRLDRFIAEFVILSLPLQPLCRADCAGLCPGCGADRNHQACACAATRSDSPFAILSGRYGLPPDHIEGEGEAR